MPQRALMKLIILLPFKTYVDKTYVSRIVAETSKGLFGVLSHRLDCVAALIPGILTYENESDGEKYIAIDGGVLVKTDLDVIVSVRNAIAGTDLGKLREVVDLDFLTVNEKEQNIRAVIAKMEIGLVRRLAEFSHV
jgi:F-type H+-transporting ATPase subunit epsilon